jgi:hypothetical protein
MTAETIYLAILTFLVIVVGLSWLCYVMFK